MEENKNIKKAYQKMSRQLKKMGFDYKCVMTSRQQELGTATICFMYVRDYEAGVEKAKASLKDTAAIEKELSHDMKETARMITTWRRWAEEGGSNAQYWKERVTEWDAGTYEERRRQEIIQRKTSWLEDEKRSFEKAGTLKEQYQKAKTVYEELRTAKPVVEFLELVNGTTIMELKAENGAEYCYLRFRY